MPTINPPLDEMTVEEKLQLVETIWASIAERPDELASPAWHGEVLRERERQVEAGEAHFISWDEAKKEIDHRLAQLRERNASATLP
jgi:putative addiction module component (TIGR02574 family)